MKILRYFSLLLLATSQLCAIHTATHKVKKPTASDAKHSFSHKKNRVRTTCEKGTRFICQNNVGVNGIVITQPGEYCLTEDILFSPINSTTSAITIATSNVTINLNGRRIIQTNAGASNIGISIQPDQNLIEITNGTIENFGALGIWVSSGAQGIRILSVNVFGCGNRGHAPYATPDNFQPNMLNFMAGGIGIGGLPTGENTVDQIEIANCRAIATQNSEDTAFDPVSGQNVAVVAVGIGATAVTGLLMSDNVTGSILSTKSTARGLSICQGTAVNVQGHQSSSIIHFKGGTGILFDTITSGLLNNAYVDNVRDLGGVDLIQRGSIGIGAVFTSDIDIQNSTVTGVRNIASTTGVAHGVDIRASINVAVTNVKTFDTAGAAALVHVAGISYAPTSVAPFNNEKIAYISKCSTVGSTSDNGNAYGISIEPLQAQDSPVAPIVDQGVPQGVIVEEIISSSNTTAGIVLRDASRCQILRSIITENTHFGIILERSSGIVPSPCHISDNVIDSNGIDATDAGIRDNYTTILPVVNNMFVNNEALNNNTVNYAGTPLFTPRITWDINTGLPTGDLNQKFANLDARS
ncbi:right-handed parallel beta-helix repeat-containing protein [Candidatus Dependentiae bacterium]|nr:right-handed parallel beta-helix repeat-containing protein [Candidatus Dependentiae bacterium]